MAMWQRYMTFSHMGNRPRPPLSPLPCVALGRRSRDKKRGGYIEFTLTETPWRIAEVLVSDVTESPNISRHKKFLYLTSQTVLVSDVTESPNI